MKAFTKIQALVLSIAMLFCVTATTAYATEPIATDSIPVVTYDFEITPDMSGSEIALLANVNNTFNVYGSHTGSTRNYYGNKLRYSVTITDANGRAANNILAIQLYSSDGVYRHEGQFWADGGLHIIQDISISYGGAYYFKYVQAYGDLRTLRVHMEITAYS